MTEKLKKKDRNKVHYCSNGVDICDGPYKSYCKCIREANKERRKNTRDRNVKGTLNILEKNDINYVYSKTSNVVILNPDSNRVNLSLKRDNGLFKCRFDGSANWYKYGKTKFLDKFKK